MAQSAKSKPSSTGKDIPESPETNNALATTPGATNLPAFMQGDAASRAGKENIARDDMIVPRVALAQAVSPEVLDARCENGNFFHTVAEEDLGEVIDDLVILHHSKRYTLWNPRHAGGGVLARASDGAHWDQDWEGEVAPYKDQPKKKVRYSVKAGEKVGRDIGLGRWGTMDPENEDSPPAATLTHVLVCVSLSRIGMGPFVVLLQRSAEPVAKMLLSKVNIDPAPIFGQIYTMGSKSQPSPSGEFNQYTFAKNGHVENEGTYLWAKEQHEAFRALGVKIDENAAQSDIPDGGGGGDDDDDDGKGKEY